MTVTTPESGFRARLRRLARTAAVFAIAVGVSGFGAGAASAADEADADTGTVDLQLSAGLRGTVAPGGALSTTVTVRNETEDELSAGRVLIEWNRTPLADDAAITGWLDDDSNEGGFETLGLDTTTRVDAGDTTSTTILIPAENLGAIAPGVYPLRATLTGATDGEGDEREAATTSVLVVAEATATQVAVLVPITATPASGAILTGEELTTLTAADGALTAQLDGIEGSAAILAIDPSIPAAIRALGTAAPESATDWLTRLDELPNDRFALQFGDADAATQAQAGLTALLQPTTLAPFLNPDNFAAAPQPTPTSTPAPSPTPSGPVLPDDAALSAVDGAVSGILWPRRELSRENLAAFDGYLGTGATTILSSSAVGDHSAGHATVGTHDVLVTAAAASDALSRAADEDDDVARQRWLAAANAHLYLASQSGTPLLIGLDRDENRPADALREAIATADTVGFGLSALRAAPASATELTSEPDPDRAPKLQLMLDDEVTLGQFSTILEDPQVLLSPERIELLRVLGVGSSDTRFAEAVTAELKETREILDAVAIPPSSTIQLLSANADLPFSVRNDLPWPVTVRLIVSPTDPRLEVQRVNERVVQGDSSTRIKVPVSARVGSGEVDLRLELTSLTGVPLGDQQTVRVAVRAEWETIGLSVFGGIAILLIGLGIVRTVRRKRREADADAEDASEVST